MKGVLLDLVTSKKFLAAVAAIAIYIAGRFGFKLDTDTLDRIYAALLVYVGAQGIADNGKSAAEVAKASTAAPAAPAAPAVAPPARPAIAGVTGAATLLLLTLGLAGLAGLAGCGAKTKAIETGLWDCTAPERAEAVSVLIPVLDSVIQAAASADGSKIDLSPIEAAITKANLLSDAGVMLSCAVATAFTTLEKPAPAAPTPGAETPAAHPAEATAPRIDPQVLQDAFNQLRAKHFPKATFKTANGNV